MGTRLGNRILSRTNVRNFRSAFNAAEIQTDEDFAEVNTAIDTLETDTLSLINTLETDTNTAISDLETLTNTNIETLETDLTTIITTLETDTDTEFTSVNTAISDLNASLSTDISSINTQLDGVTLSSQGDGESILANNGVYKKTFSTLTAIGTGHLDVFNKAVFNSTIIEKAVHPVIDESLVMNLYLGENGLFFNPTLELTQDTTINFTADATNTLNSYMGLATNKYDSLTFVAIINQGATPYILGTFQIDGAAITPRWANGASPTTSTANATDIYTFTIFKTADATFEIIASYTSYS